MIINATLTRDQFVRILLLRHFNRTPFYFYAVTAAAVTGYWFIYDSPPYLLIIWIPFLMYISLGVFEAWRSAGNKDHPAYSKTRYKFTNHGILITSTEGDSDLSWEHFGAWRMVAGCYTLIMNHGPILAIPQNAIAHTSIPRFEEMLRKHIPM